MIAATHNAAALQWIFGGVDCHRGRRTVSRFGQHSVGPLDPASAVVRPETPNSRPSRPDFAVGRHAAHARQAVSAAIDGRNRVDGLGRQPGAEGPLAIGTGGLLPFPPTWRMRARLNPKERVAHEGEGRRLAGDRRARQSIKRTSRGLITEVHSADGSPPYVVRWLDSDHVATVFPGTDAVVVTAAEQAAADERAQHRFGAVQSAIHHGNSE